MGSQGAKGGRNTGLGTMGKEVAFSPGLERQVVWAGHSRGNECQGQTGTWGGRESRALVERALELRLAWRGELDQGGRDLEGQLGFTGVGTMESL